MVPRRCAVDEAGGYLYASMWDQTKTIYVYDVNNEMAFAKGENGPVLDYNRIIGIFVHH